MDNETMQVLQDKIDQLNRQAWDVRVYDSLKSLELSRESVELARSINYHSGLAHGLKSLGFSYIRIAKNNEALPLLQEALALFESLNDLKGEAVAYEYLAIIERNWGNFGAALELLFKALELSERTEFIENAGTEYYHIGVTYKYLGNFEKALDWLYKSLSIYREINNRLFQSYPINIIGSIYFENGDYTHALEYYQEGLMLRQESQDKLGEAGSLDNIGFTYFKLNDYPQAIDYCTRSLAISESTGDKRSQANAMQHLAEIYKQAGDAVQATKVSNDSLQIRKQIGDKRGETEILLFLASLHKEQPGKRHEISGWLGDALAISEEIKGLDLLSKTRFALYEYYKEEEKFKEAIEQLELHIELEKELHKNTINQKMLNLEISHKAEEAKKETDTIRLRNEELNELNAGIREQKEKLEITLADLKSTQAQLIQSEKMASLGELTAGIAHEIQNPLNFVNNFSEISKELIEELKAEIKKGNIEEVNAIADDLEANEEKINHHGKRADAIVKGMLQHSRSSSGIKEPTDINALADEYLRLAYHGLRAKEKTFNATLKTDYDETIGKIDIIPQDIGRVLLNLYNNAFYAVTEKKKQLGEGYEPTITVTTALIPPLGGGGAEIRVTDNGKGIPQKVLDKIFQPFFTTKPTGQGTGLGLSLAYDIIKAHGGELKVETKEGDFAEFIIQLPIV
jgi:two-component system NtrC family sensor kinase